MDSALRYLIVMVVMLSVGTALADISKCIDAAGNITYTDAGCPEGTREVEKIPEVPSAETKKLRPKVPLKNRLDRLKNIQNYRGLVTPYGVLGVYGVMSLICFAAYWHDKRKARNRQWRTPETTLHILELLGGWPGGLVAQQVLRHKNRKASFQAVFWCIVALHGLIWADVLLDQQISSALLEFAKSFI